MVAIALNTQLSNSLIEKGLGESFFISADVSKLSDVINYVNQPINLFSGLKSEGVKQGGDVN